MTAVRLAQFWKFLLTVPGLIAVVVSLGFLHGHALEWAIAAEAVGTRLLVVLGPRNKTLPAVQGAPATVDVGPGTTVPEPPTA